MNTYTHLFFDMDQTIAPSRQPILPEMFTLLEERPEDIVIVSGQATDKCKWQSNNLTAYVLGQNGNHAIDPTEDELWYTPLTETEQSEIMQHVEALIELLPESPNPDWHPIENRGAQITFSPIGNTAPVEHKSVYDPDRTKRLALLEQVPFVSDRLVVKIGGSTSLDYIHKDRHKGYNVQKLIDDMNWQNKDCVYFGDGLYPGGNDEAVIGVIDTVPVTDHMDTFKKLNALFSNQDQSS